MPQAKGTPLWKKLYPDCLKNYQKEPLKKYPILFRCAKRSILPNKAETSQKRMRSFYGQNSTAQSHKIGYFFSNSFSHSFVQSGSKISTAAVYFKFSNVKSDFAPAAKVSSQREPIPYICGLRARIGCEPVSEHSTRSDRVTNIGDRLSLGASLLPVTNQN